MMGDIASVVSEGDVFVFNDTYVDKVAFYLDDSRFILVIEPEKSNFDDVKVICPFKPSVGESFKFDFGSIILDTHEPGWDVYHAHFHLFHEVGTMRDLLEKFGQFPLPIYIRRQPDARDEEALQGYYAVRNGSIAPPVAGTHFDSETIASMTDKGVSIAKITLHVGYGTFRSFKTEYVDQHAMDPEWYSIPLETIAVLKRAREEGKRVVAVGTTVARALETVGSVWEDVLKSGASVSGETTIFIQPPYKPKLITGLITNFQYPRLPVICMAASFVGLDNLRNVYGESVKRGYKYYSYGDAMFLEF